MSKKIKLELTEAQLNAIMNLTDEASARIGGGDNDTDRIKCVNLIDRMLNKNGYKRKYK